jgi:hypothetical protein
LADAPAPPRLARDQPWDPLASWPSHYRQLGILLALIVLALQAWPLITSFWPPLVVVGPGQKVVPDYSADYFQDWASGRHFWEQRERYPRLALKFDELMGPDPKRVVYVERNAHPPACILLVIPFCLFDYQLSFLLWDLFQFLCFVLGVWLIGRELSLRWSWQLILMLSGAMMFCGPLRQQVMQGQFNGLLVLLVAAAWRDCRHGQMARAGVWVAIATAIKFYPGFLFFHFIVRGQWRPVFTGTLTFLGIMALTWLVLGTDAFRVYVTEVMPLVSQCRAGWPNASLQGIWSKLFDAGNGNDAARLILLWHDPNLCFVGSVVCAVFVAATWFYGLWFSLDDPQEERETAQRREDLRFCLSLITMSLISPVTWDHYLLVLILPLFVMARQLSWSDWRAWLLAVLAGVCCLSPPTLWALVDLNKDGKALPWQTLTALSIHLYALVIWFWLNWRMLRAVGHVQST